MKIVKFSGEFLQFELTSKAVVQVDEKQNDRIINSKNITKITITKYNNLKYSL